MFDVNSASASTYLKAVGLCDHVKKKKAWSVSWSVPVAAGPV